LRHDILSFEEVQRALATADDASFVARAPARNGVRPPPERLPAERAAIALEVEV